MGTGARQDLITFFSLYIVVSISSFMIQRSLLAYRDHLHAPLSPDGLRMLHKQPVNI